MFGRFDPAIDDYDVVTSEPDGTHARLVVRGPAECPRWSSDGTQLALCAPDAAGRLRPEIAAPDGSGIVPVAISDPSLNLACWAWSSQGLLACEGWSEHEPERGGIYVVRSADGGGLRRLTAFGVPGDFSPDGSRLVLLKITDGADETGALYVVNVDGTGLRRIGPTDAADPGSWSPDGGRILFSTSDGRLFVEDPTGGSVTEIPLEVGPDQRFCTWPAWSPDGTRILACVRDERAGTERYYTMDADGGDPRPVIGTREGDDFADWAPPAG